MSTEPITDGERANFDTLRTACKDDNLALIVCETKNLAQRTLVICAMNAEEDGSVCPVPLAKMFTGNPYEELRDPTDDMAAAGAAISDAAGKLAAATTGRPMAKDVVMAVACEQGWSDDTLLSLLLDFCDEHGCVGQLKEHLERVAKATGNEDE